VVVLEFYLYFFVQKKKFEQISTIGALISLSFSSFLLFVGVLYWVIGVGCYHDLSIKYSLPFKVEVGWILALVSFLCLLTSLMLQIIVSFSTPSSEDGNQPQGYSVIDVDVAFL